MSDVEKTMVGILPAREAELLRSKLARAGIDVACIYNHSTCTTGCSPSMELWAHPDDVGSIRQFVEDSRAQIMKELGADLSIINEVFDSSKPEATCPACGTLFKTTNVQCPECGLQFG